MKTGEKLVTWSASDLSALKGAKTMDEARRLLPGRTDIAIHRQRDYRGWGRIKHFGGPAERLAAMTDKAGTCWLFTGRLNNDGYGDVRVGPRKVKAHRLAWALANGRAVPEGMSVLHECDNPPCVRPDHLFIGTQADNMLDCARKGRVAGAKITSEQAASIRDRYAKGGITQARLGELHGISQSNVTMIISGKTWAHVGAEA